MRQIKKLYNVMALALEKINKCTNERDYEIMRNLEEDYETAIVEELKKKFPDMFDKETRNAAEISELNLMETSLIQDLDHYVAMSGNKEELIFLIKHLDSFLEDTFYGCIPIDQEQYRFQCLNDNFPECQIYLLPRIICKWEHQNRDAYTSYSIFYYLRNFYYVLPKDINTYEVEHILMPRNLFKDAIKRGGLRVAVSPLTKEHVVETTEPYVKENARFISIEPMKPDIERKIITYSVNALQKAVLEESDLLVFPEMLGTDAIARQLEEELDTREHVIDNGSPCLIICPTIWNRNRNFCRVLNDMGDIVCEQQKHHGVDLKLGQSQVKEDIISNRKIYILHCYGVGRIAVMICKDFLITSYLKILVEKLKVSLLIVPSFTAKDYQFEVLSSKYGDQDCSVIWLNTCAARWLDESREMKPAVTLAYLPGRAGVKKDKITAGELCFGRQNCDSGCLHIYQIRWEM